MTQSFSYTAKPLGKSSMIVSPIAWGMWRFAGRSVDQGQHLIETALEAGITLFDTADIYGFDGTGGFGDAEALLGQVLSRSPALRSQMVLASKGGITPPVPYDSSADYLIAACEASLRRLATERIDLYQIHRPDVLVHPAEIAQTLDQLRRAGKIGEVGVSNYTPAQTAALAAYLPFPLVSVQPEFSAFAIHEFEAGVLDQALERDWSVLAWSPLGRGMISDPGDDPRARAVSEALDAIARREGVPRSVVAYAWVLRHPTQPIPIIGSQQPARIREAMGAVSLQLSRSDWYSVLTAARGVPLP